MKVLKLACKKGLYLEEGIRRYSELQTQELLVDAVLSCHQLTGLWCGRYPWKSEAQI